jgi:Kef-type K+ transport system membrane component KefB
MAGLIVAETVVKERVEKLALPIRDAFAAVFFFWFGLNISPAGLAAVATPVLAAVALSLTINLLTGIISARMNGLGRLAAANIGTTVLARGEFSIIIAALATTPGSTNASPPSSGSTSSSSRSPARCWHREPGGSAGCCRNTGDTPHPDTHARNHRSEGAPDHRRRCRHTAHDLLHQRVVERVACVLWS